MIRKFTQDDLPLLREWMKHDPLHEDVDPSVFLDPDAEVFACFDDRGVVFFLRCTRVIRYETQFNPASYDSAGSEERARAAKLMPMVYPVLAKMAAAAGYKQLIYESVYRPLIRFCRRLGFKRSENEHIASIDRGF